MINSRKIGKFFLILSGSLLVLILVSLAGVQVFLSTPMAGRMIQSRINPYISGRIDWQAQRVSIFRGRATIRDLVLYGEKPGAKDAAPIIQAARVMADLRLADLLSGTVMVETAELESPGVFLEMDSSGRLNLLEAVMPASLKPAAEPPPRGDGLPFNIRMGEVSVNRGRFSFVRPVSVNHGRFSFVRPAGDGPAGGKQEREITLDAIDITARAVNLDRRAGRVELSVGGGRVDMGGIRTPLQKLTLSARLAGGEVGPLKLALHTPGSQLVVSGAVAAVFEKPALDLDLSLASELSAIRRMLDLDTELAGPLKLDLKASGTLDNPDVAAALDYGAGRIAGVDVDKLSLKCRMQDRAVAVQRLEARLAYGRFQSSGSVNLKKAFADGFLSPPFRLDEIAYIYDLESSRTPISQIPGIDGAISGEIKSRLHLEGRGIRPDQVRAKAEAHIHASRVSAGKSLEPIDLDIDGRAEIEGSWLKWQDLSVRTQGARLQSGGVYDWTADALEAQAEGRISSLEAFLKPLPAARVSGASGSVDFQAEITGPARLPDLTASLSGSKLAYRDFVLGSLRAELGFKDGRLGIDSLALSNQSSKLAVSGALQVMEEKSGAVLSNPPLDLTIAESRLHLAHFLPGMAERMGGRVALSGHVGGRLHAPEGAITIKGRDLRTGVQSIPAADLECRIRGRRIYLEPLTVSLGPGSNGQSGSPPANSPEPSADIRAQGWVSLDRDYELQLSSGPVDLSVIKALKETDLQGHLKLEANGAGNLSDPRAQGRVDLSGLKVAGRPLADIRISANLQDHILRVRSAAPASVKGRFDLSSRDFTASVQLSETDLAPYFEMAGRSALSGRISASLEASGNAENPAGIRGRLDIESLFVQINETELMRTSDFKVLFADSRMTLSENRLRFMEKGEVQLDGYADWAGAVRGNAAESETLNLTARGRIPAGVAGGLVPGIDNPVGAVELDVRVGGTIEHPEVLAKIGLNGLGCTVSETLQKLHHVNGHIRLTEEAVTISKLTGRLDGGEFSLDGKVRLNRFKPGESDLSLTARVFPVVVPDVVEAQINTDLKFSGSPSQSRLSGEVLLLEGRYYKNFNLSLLGTVQDIGRRKRETAPQRPGLDLDVPYLRNLSLDVSFSHRQPFVVDNNMAMMRVRPELRMKGTVNQPLVTGRAAVSEGTVTYRNTEFEVKKGVVDFVDPYRIEPAVNIEAEAAVRKWVITLEVSGPPDDLDLQLSSEPPEEDADILSLLAVGETTRELASGSGEARPPEEMLANLVAGRLEKRIKEGTGLDILELKYQENGSGEDAGNGVQVTVGKELSRRLTVKYGVERKSGIVVQQSTAIYKLLESLAVNAYQDSEGAFGGEMRYRLEFR